MTSGIEKVMLLTEQLRKLLPMKAEYQQRLVKTFRLEFNYNSNHLEGNTLTYGETELLLIFDRTTGNHELREYEEMKGHDVAYEMIKELAAETPIKMGELIEWLREEEEKKDMHPVVLASLLHYNFVRIHPFDDGNGRLSRLLMNYILFKHGLPPVVIKSA